MFTKRLFTSLWSCVFGSLAIACVMACCATSSAFEGNWSLTMKNQKDHSEVPLAIEGETFTANALKGTVKVTPHPFGQQVRIDVDSTAKRDRGFTLRYAFKIDATGKNWCGVLGNELVIPAGDRFISDSYDYNPRDFLTDGRDKVKWKDYPFPKQSL
ncbi:MAG: hypothetical protein Q4G59_07365, partial [Planctomycetia bacterium]|nr:hypothetical protein [Planctomycetia bacterium]